MLVIEISGGLSTEYLYTIEIFTYIMQKGTPKRQKSPAEAKRPSRGQARLTLT